MIKNLLSFLCLFLFLFNILFIFCYFWFSLYIYIKNFKKFFLVYGKKQNPQETPQIDSNKTKNKKNRSWLFSVAVFLFFSDILIFLTKYGKNINETLSHFCCFFIFIIIGVPFVFLFFLSILIGDPTKEQKKYEKNNNGNKENKELHE